MIFVSIQSKRLSIGTFHTEINSIKKIFFGHTRERIFLYFELLCEPKECFKEKHSELLDVVTMFLNPVYCMIEQNIQILETSGYSN